MTVSESLLKTLISIRRNLHENPEIGYQEFETTKLVAGELEKLQIPFEAGVAGMKTGIVSKAPNLDAANDKTAERPALLLFKDL